MPQERLVKIVRDRIPEHLADSEVTYKEIGDYETIDKELRKKLAEEVAEYLIEPGLEELADVYSVVRALAEVSEGVTESQLKDAVRRKNERKGPMLKGMGMYVNTLTVEEFDLKQRKTDG